MTMIKKVGKATVTVAVLASAAFAAGCATQHRHPAASHHGSAVHHSCKHASKMKGNKCSGKAKTNSCSGSARGNSCSGTKGANSCSSKK